MVDIKNIAGKLQWYHRRFAFNFLNEDKTKGMSFRPNGTSAPHHRELGPMELYAKTKPESQQNQQKCVIVWNKEQISSNYYAVHPTEVTN